MFFRQLSRDIRCFTFFATHFHEIGGLADYVPAVKNFYMNAIVDDKNFTLLYQLKPGIVDRSFGIHVATLARFPENLIQVQ